MTLGAFREVWVVDSEFVAAPGERPVPVCMVALETRTGRLVRLWQDDLLRSSCPYSSDRDALFVAFFASAELGCHRALGWPDPLNILDLYVEYRNLVNGRSSPYPSSLLGAAMAFQLDGVMSVTEKDRGRELVLRGGPWLASEKQFVFNYCESDVRLTARLFDAMWPHVDVPRALLRGRFMAAVAAMEHQGIPIDRPALDRLRTGWPAIKNRLIENIDRPFGVYEGTTFRQDRFAAWLVREGIPWPRLPSGHLELTDDVFRQMAKVHPQVAPLRELRHALSQLRLSELAVGSDNRNRVLLSPFRASSGRCAPSTSRFIFGPSVWLRHLIRPQPGTQLAYVDYEQQEFGTAAALSHDGWMIAAYQSGDPYLSFAKQAGAVPTHATKTSHGPIRELYKIASLAVLYGMRAASLAARIGRSESDARALLCQHHDSYPAFWKWSAAAVDFAMLRGRIHTVFGWTLHVGPTTTDRTVMNFPMQGNGAEMLRLACVFAIARGVAVCAPIHDALLIEAPEDRMDEAVAITREAMREASAAVLNGFSLRTEAKVIRFPDRYSDPRGHQMWATVQAILHETPCP